MMTPNMQFRSGGNECYPIPSAGPEPAFRHRGNALSASAPRPPGQKRRRGFTVIELLVSVAVIVILAAILIVGLGKVRVAAGKAQGTSNLRQLGAGLQMRANANDGKMTPFRRITHFSARRPPAGGRYERHLHAFLSGGDGLYPEFVEEPSVHYHPLDKIYKADPFFFSSGSPRWSFHAFGMDRRLNELTADDVLIKDRGSPAAETREQVRQIEGPFRKNSAARAQDGVLVLFGDFHVEFFEWSGSDDG